MKLISAYIPEEFVSEKEKINKTWRMVIAQGLNSENKIKDLTDEAKYFQERVLQLNIQIKNMNRKFKILEDIKKGKDLNK